MSEQFSFPKPNGTKFTMPLAGLRQMVERAPAGNSDVAAVLGGLAAAYGRVLDAHTRYMADGTLTANARLVRSARNARSTMEPAVTALRRARESAAGTRASLEARVAKVFDFSGDFAACMISAEIRSHFASLPAGDRMGAVAAAIEAKDAVTLKAIGAGPPFLSGLPADRQSYVKNALVDLIPDAAAARDAAKALAEQDEVVALVETTVLQGVADLIDFQSAASFERVASEAVAA